MMRYLIPSLCMLLSVVCILPAGAQILLDSELTTTLQKLAAPVQAHMPRTQQARFVIVADDSLNAYVDPDAIVHVHSGLIAQVTSAAELQGVLAHELGHVSAQHIQQMRTEAAHNTLGMLGGTLLGIGTAVAGAPQAGMAIAMGSQAGALSNLLQFSRMNEHEADRLGLGALHAAHLSGKPMVELFTKLRTDSQLSFGSPPPYLLTHPLPAERIQNLEQATAQDPTPTEPLTAQEWARFRAKAYALTHTPPQTLRKFTGSTEADTYARVYAYALQGKLQQAQTLLTPLQTAHPNDIFYTETAAFIAQDGSHVAASIPLFQKVLAQNPALTFTRYGLAESYRAQNQLAQALPNLEQVTREWPDWPAPWQSLGLVYGQLGHLPESHLALAEYHISQGEKREAQDQLKLATHYLKETPKNPLAQQWAEALKSRLKDLPAQEEE